LVLNQWRAEDVEDVTAACQDPEIGRWTRVPWPYTREHAVAFLEIVGPHWAEDSAYNWAIRRTPAGPPIGSIGLKDVNLEEGTAEVGYWIAAAARGQGVATAATIAVVNWALDPAGLGLRRVDWCAAVGNDASRVIAEKAGIKVLGTKPIDPAAPCGQCNTEMWYGSATASAAPTA
jgi:RimJ/RimL family protein N-acetyltransferase